MKNFFAIVLLLLTVAVSFISNKLDLEKYIQKEPFQTNRIPDQYFQNFRFIKVDLPQTLQFDVLSATQLNPMFIFYVLMTSTITVIFLAKLLRIGKFQFSLILSVILIGNYIWLLCVNEPIDEFYVWASKVQNLLTSGRLGVQLYDETFGESTVGFLQFLLAAIPRLLGLTIEQSIYLPLYISITVSQVLVFSLIRKSLKSVWIATIVVIAIYLNPVLLKNFILGFDNVLAYALLIGLTWSELNNRNSEKWPRRLFFIVVFPLIRLDFFVVSVGIVILHFIDKRQRNLKNTVKEILKFRIQNISACLVFVTWIGYKAWAFGDLVPAMAKYKGGFYGSKNLVISGFLQAIQALSIPEFLSFPALIFILLALLIFIKQLNVKPKVKSNNDDQLTHLYRIFWMNTIYLLFGILSRINAGGDYFGSDLMRYEFPFLINIFIIALIILGTSFLNTRKTINLKFLGNLNLFAIFFLALSILWDTPVKIKSMLEQTWRVEQSKTSCEFGAAKAIQAAFRQNNVVATHEFGGFPYHLNAKVADLYGLVDSRFVTDGYVGENSANKLRILLPLEAIDKVDLLWLYPGTDCNTEWPWATGKWSDKSILQQVVTPVIPNEVSSDASYQERRLNDLINVLGFRVIDFNEYISRGFKPVVIYFTFYQGETKYYGQTYFFARNN